MNNFTIHAKLSAPLLNAPGMMCKLHDPVSMSSSFSFSLSENITSNRSLTPSIETAEMSDKTCVNTRIFSTFVFSAEGELRANCLYVLTNF